MDKKCIDPKIMKVIRYFAERLQEDGIKVSRIVVFGSRLDGTVHEYSDIDLIVVSEDFRKKNLFKRVDMTYKAYSATIEKFLIPIDLVLETPEEFNPEFCVVVYAA